MPPLVGALCFPTALRKVHHQAVEARAADPDAQTNKAVFVIDTEAISDLCSYQDALRCERSLFYKVKPKEETKTTTKCLKTTISSQRVEEKTTTLQCE